MTPTVRLVAVLALALFAGSTVAEARGAGSRIGGAAGVKRGSSSRRASAQTENLIQESFRRDALRRLRHADW